MVGTVCRPEAPTLGFNSGWFSLTFPVRPGVEVSSVMAEIAKQFGASDKAQVSDIDPILCCALW